MTVLRHAIAVGVLFGGLHSTLIGVQVDQKLLERQLLGANLDERSLALGTLLTMGPQKAEPSVRAALITALERANGVVAETRKRGITLDIVERPEDVALLSRLVAELRDPRAIPALSRATYGGLPVARALASFGDPAVRPLVAVVSAVSVTDGHYYEVDHGLTALRFMVEQRNARPLSNESMRQIREAVEQLLRGEPYFTTLWHSIDLAIATEDPKLRGIVELMATFSSEVVARGLTDLRLIERTQQRAAERLAGVPALPSPER